MCLSYFRDGAKIIGARHAGARLGRATCLGESTRVAGASGPAERSGTSALQTALRAGMIPREGRWRAAVLRRWRVVSPARLAKP